MDQNKKVIVPDIPEHPDRIIPEHIDLEKPSGDHAGTIFFTSNPLVWVIDFDRAKGGKPEKD